MVGWYSGYPSSSPPLLDHSSAIVIGNGNVSLDCARVLASPRRLEHTVGEIEGVKGISNDYLKDIPDEALELIRKSRVRNISIVGRRGPGDVSY